MGRPPSAGFGLRAFGQEVCTEDVQVWTEKGKSSQVSLSMYCEKLLPLLREEEGKAYWMLYTLTDQDPKADCRMDVFAGVTRCPALVNEYLSQKGNIVDTFRREGIVPGFFCYSLSCFAEKENRGEAILDFRDELEASVRRAAGEETVTFLGGASGIYCGYPDFIAWDISAVLSAAAEFLKKSPVEWAVFCSFRRDSEVIRLAEKQRFVLK